MLLRPAVMLALASACHGHGHGDSNSDGDDCSRAVRHFVELDPLGDDSAEGRAFRDAIVSSITAACRKEGLSHEVTACILAVHWPEPGDQLRGCPAFAAPTELGTPGAGA